MCEALLSLRNQFIMTYLLFCCADLLAWTTTRKTWSNVREEAMAEWELSRPYIFSSFLKSQVLDQPCETCDEQASVL